MSNNKEQKGPFMWRAAEHSVEKLHRAGCMGKSGQAGLMERSNEHTYSNANRFDSIVVFQNRSIFFNGIWLHKASYQPGSNVKKRLIGIGPQRSQRCQPFGRGTM